MLCFEVWINGKKERVVGFESAEEYSGASTILAEAVGKSPEGVPVSVILHAREGEISELEVISMDATEVFSMPKPEMLQVI
ncbi:MAG: hypothetical protein ABR568_17790 [Pyrinomonadaceae bacterium]